MFQISQKAEDSELRFVELFSWMLEDESFQHNVLHNCLTVVVGIMPACAETSCIL
jgi:hypothetical protein